MATTFLDDVKVALRITNIAFDGEVADLIAAARLDLTLSGVTDTKANDDTDSLIKRAILIYVKANFGWANPDADRLQISYNLLKMHLSMTIEYSYYGVIFEIKDGLNPIDEVEIIFDGVRKLTGLLGVATFYVRAGNNYAYEISASGYGSSVANIDISASTTIPINLVPSVVA